MGFGIMFIGCCLMLLGAITPLSTFTYVIGSAIVLYSLKELIAQNKLFVASMIAIAIEFLLSMANMFVQVLSPTLAIAEYLALALSFVNIASCVILATAIYKLAKAVGLPSIQTKIIITYIFMGIYFVAMLLLNVVFKQNEFAIERLSVIVTIAQLLYVIMILVVVANSYIRICYEDDVDMSKKSSSSSLNFLNDKLDMAMTPREKRENNDNEGEKRK
ncbi:MAG: hypothetical protein IJD42_05430 [Clostridia bacterium]|nr:hypothetical protein [Clostridia bacterium]